MYRAFFRSSQPFLPSLSYARTCSRTIRSRCNFFAGRASDARRNPCTGGSDRDQDQRHSRNSTSYVTVFTNDDVKQTPALVVDDALRNVPGFNTFRRSSSIVTAPADDPEAEGCDAARGRSRRR